jgi:hypothetical protein
MLCASDVALNHLMDARKMFRNEFVLFGFCGAPAQAGQRRK